MQPVPEQLRNRESDDGLLIRLVLVGLGVFVVFLPLFSRLTGLPDDPRIMYTDYLAHLRFAEKLAGDWRECLPHPLFHIAVVILSAGNSIAMPGITACLLSGMIALRTFQTARILTTDEESSSGVGARLWLPAVLLAMLLMLAMPLPNWWKSGVYLGQPTPNVWHNPTTIFCMPLVLMLFPIGVRSTESLRLGDSLLTGVLFVICALAKPNFPLAFAPACGLMLALRLWQKESVRRVLMCGVAMLLPLVLLMGAQFLLTFGSESKAGIAIAPFKIWREYSPNFPASTVLGLAFPLAVVCLFPRSVVSDRFLCWAWVTQVLAGLQFILLTETGDRWSHANFAWGTIFAAAITFIYSARVLLMAQDLTRRRICVVILSLQAASGLWVLIRAFQDPEHVTSF